MADPRSIWLVTHNGVTQGFVWALTKREEDAVTGNPSWECALRADQSAAAGWDATPTTWRRVPSIAYPGVLNASATPTLTGRTLAVGGCTFDLDTGGRAHPDGGEALEPDATVVSVDDLVAHVEAAGVSIDMVEKGTLKKVRVYPTEPDDPNAGGAVNSAIYRRQSDNTPTRSDV